MKVILPLFTLFLLIACASQDDEVNPNDIDSAGPVNVGTIEKAVPYGPESRQFVDIYAPASDCPTPVYFDAHGNGGNTSIPEEIVQALNTAGIAVVAWESLTSVNTPAEVETGWADAELMFQWVMDNADAYNFDVTNLIIGGSSRGSILSWKYAHRSNPNIKGLYMYNALPNSVWAMPAWWQPTQEVTLDSPPVFFVYKREPGSGDDPIDPDGHDPQNGITIVERYESLGIGDLAELVHSIGATQNSDKYQFLLEFALSVLDAQCQ